MVIEMIDVNEKYRQLETIILDYMPRADIARIRNAFEYAVKAHDTQLRKDGNAFVTHPLAVAEIVAEIGMDEDSLCSALLHDCIEDTSATYEEIEKLFGEDVARIVEGVTKLTRVTYTSAEEEQMENLRKMLFAMAQDIRVILIKLADRLHNTRTLAYMAEGKQREIALETMEMYAPIAHRLGMQRMKWELEDLSIRYLDPVACNEITEELKLRHIEDETFLNAVHFRLTERLSEHGIACQVTGRVKHIYSIYRKMYSENKLLSEVLDLHAFRIIVNDIADCYNVLGHIHELYRPIPGCFKDYIGTPKPNMYQSLHTNVIGSEGMPFEVQIRTWEMHQTAEYGIAAHWKYKEGKGDKIADEEKFSWVRRLLESQQDSDAQEFMHALKVDMFADEVFVFTPRGDVINLPAGSTPIDFAYSIHSEVGNKMTGATVNGRIVSYAHALNNGDIVKIMTSNSAKGPSRDWLNIIKSPEAKNKIRQWFKKERRDDNIEHGKRAFESQLDYAKITIAEATRDDILNKVLSRASFGDIDEMYAAIGYGGISALKVVNRIREELRIAAKVKKDDPPQTPAEPDEIVVSKRLRGVTVEDMSNCLVKFARCCSPIPGDAISGFITRGFGVSVHRQDCINYIKSHRESEETDRWVRVSWADTSGSLYSTTIDVKAADRIGIVVDVASVLNTINVKISSFNAREASGGMTDITIVIEVNNRNELISAMAKLMAVSGVTDVRRTEG
ncbi:MAG: bifunctional (p)ppGpp synthetase/guanosine-3',5'-bis(diphosphate) 3'-pyrophosphohydrolase [Oscillospiraceae bacterium]|jgi:GTP pyrophosphokinase|nr:bifunctional (p)ppGpp synthetase/guanosine-3',5'-bis(diphosphate) 3'-pyrophosphohydrolase [Oscillospiraceae bacterium]